ncbi:MAG: F0F1 ATP synthase subunit delta [Paramuribaculum sp.]|nr:F0F1 ATP synthase subunit delta [Paramuribaculum sp.]
MNEGLIPKRYAKAIYEVAAQKGVQQRIYDLMNNLAHAFEIQPDIQKALANPFVASQDKKKLILTAAQATSDDTEFNNFLTLLQNNNRFASARAIALAYLETFRNLNNIKVVKVCTAAPLDPEEEKRLKKIIASHLGNATMEYSTQVNPELIGGFTVQSGNERLDASVANELKQLRLNLISK